MEMISHVPRKYHDMPGVSGLSPYEIVYGRQRPLAGLPYSIPKVSEDVVEFFKIMESMDKRVARKLNEEHERRVSKINQSRKEKPLYELEDKVWFKRPAGLTAGLVSVWEGPGTGVRRTGKGSYVVSNSGGGEQAVNDDQMKEYVVDQYAGMPVSQYY